MTAKEILDKIGDLNTKNEKTNTVVGYQISNYYELKQFEEAINYIQTAYECDREIAQEAFTLFKDYMDERLREDNIEPLTPERIAYVNAREQALRENLICPRCGSAAIEKQNSIVRSGWLTMFHHVNITTMHCMKCGHRW